MLRNLLVLFFLSFFALSCKPTEHQRKLIADIEKSLATMEQEIKAFEGEAEILSKGQAKFDDINANLKKERKGKVDSLYNALVKERRKIVDAHLENLEKAKTAMEGMKSLLEKLNQPINFTYSAELIEGDYTAFDVMYVEAKPALEASTEERKRIEEALEARLKAIESEKLALATSATAEQKSSKSATAKPEKKAKKKK